MSERRTVGLAELLCGPCQFALVEQEGWTPRFAVVTKGDYSHCKGCQAKVGVLLEFEHGQGRAGVDFSSSIPGMTPEQEWENTAIHEAAHAVVGLKLGIGIDGIWMVGGTHVKGGVELNSTAEVKYTDGALFAATPHDKGAAMMAGVEAERYWLELRDMDTPANLVNIAAHGGGDAADLEASTRADDYPRFVAECRRIARRVIRENWALITAVAEHLVTHGGADAAWLVEQVTGAGQQPPASMPESGPESHDAAAQAPKVPAPRSKKQSTPTPNAGGIAMPLIDQARTTLTVANERATYIVGALRQAQLDLETNAAEVAGVSTEGQTPQEVAGVYRQAMDQIEQVMGLIQTATTSAETYAASLHS